MRTLLCLFLSFFAFHSNAQHLQRVSPQQVGMNAEKLMLADEVIQKAIDNKEIPGAVLAVVRNGKMAHIKALGNKQILPSIIPMEENTVFDMASVSKPMSTAIATLILVEQGKLSLRDKVNLHIPSFQGWTDQVGKKTDIRVIDLLTHTSGLPSYAPVKFLESICGAPNPEGLMQYIDTCRRDFEPKSDFQYSCLNFITLQHIIEKISTQNLRDFSKKYIFDVLDMKHTDYNPSGEMLTRCAPTEKQTDGSFLTGHVHDPLARIMNAGISGNAGVFSSADDIAILATCLLNGGAYQGKRILSPRSIKIMTSVPKGLEQFGRTPGWDMHSSYASIMGDLLGTTSYGHTGYTGTSIVIDPETNTAIILLTNRVHPEDKGSVTRLRTLVANAVTASIIN